MRKLYLFLACLLFAPLSLHAELPVLKAGVLKFGTVNWELQVIKTFELDKENGFNLEIVPFAGKQASSTALHGGAVDMIVSDWIWVSRQRSEGRLYSFIPYSRMVGALMVKPDMVFTSFADLKGKKIGIAGGPVDKSWLLFQALAKKQDNVDLAKSIDAVFGAPPLLSKKLESGELDGVINFWHFAAKLEAKGFKRAIDVHQALDQLGLNVDVPMLGYVFAPKFENDQTLIKAMSKASRQAKAILKMGDEGWEAIFSLMKADSPETFQALKNGFLNGIPEKWGETERTQANELFGLLAEWGGAKLVGKSDAITSGTFVKGIQY